MPFFVKFTSHFCLEIQFLFQLIECFARMGVGCVGFWENLGNNWKFLQLLYVLEEKDTMLIMYLGQAVTAYL